MRWQRGARSGSERYDLWTRAGLYALLALVPLLALGLVQGQQQVRPPGVTAFLLLSVAQAGICVALLRASLVPLPGHRAGTRHPPWPSCYWAERWRWRSPRCLALRCYSPWS